MWEFAIVGLGILATIYLLSYIWEEAGTEVYISSLVDEHKSQEELVAEEMIDERITQKEIMKAIKEKGWLEFMFLSPSFSAIGIAIGVNLLVLWLRFFLLVKEIYLEEFVVPIFDYLALIGLLGPWVIVAIGSLSWAMIKKEAQKEADRPIEPIVVPQEVKASA